ncbi:MAG: dihydrofolate reductase family protein [Patescibacteria group bacterium]|nr:dihydrofolate reductase family protein [Patescibacteria group bacterium]MDE2590415.1 dihydrofolate reductase family protein [Patescibacteria group bacterium]
MRKLIITEYITLDGIFEEPGRWSFDFWSEEAARYKADELFASDVQLLGRVTYEGFANAWPKMEQETGEFGKKMNAMLKYVVSSTLQNPSWKNTLIISKNILEKIQNLKNQDGGNILVAGSGQLVPFLMANNLIDEFHFLLHPVVLGKGKRLFTNPQKFVLQLVETKTLPNGLIALQYVPKK